MLGWGKHPPANLGLPTHEPAENLDENRGHEESHDPHRAPIPSLAQTRSPTMQLHTCRWVTVSLALIGCLPFVPSNRVPSKLGVSACLWPFYPGEALRLPTRRSWRSLHISVTDVVALRGQREGVGDHARSHFTASPVSHRWEWRATAMWSFRRWRSSVRTASATWLRISLAHKL